MCLQLGKLEEGLALYETAYDLAASSAEVDTLSQARAIHDLVYGLILVISYHQLTVMEKKISKSNIYKLI